MIAIDVNVLVGAHRTDAPEHEALRAWLETTVNGPSPFGVPGIVASGYLRVVTHPRVFANPTPVGVALEQMRALIGAPNAARLDPGPRHWRIFDDLCARGRAFGNLVPDAYIAAIAIEHGAELVTLDRGFGRWPGLRWREPVAA